MESALLLRTNHSHRLAPMIKLVNRSVLHRMEKTRERSNATHALQKLDTHRETTMEDLLGRLLCECKKEIALMVHLAFEPCHTAYRFFDRLCDDKVRQLELLSVLDQRHHCSTRTFDFANESTE